MRTPILFKLLITAVLIVPLVQASPVLILDPTSAIISGTPGSTVGWGFSLTNDANYAMVTAAIFCEGALTTQPCMEPLAAFTDFIGPRPTPIVLGPTGTPIAESFDLATQSGLGSFWIDPATAPGTRTIGTIWLFYDLYAQPDDPEPIPGFTDQTIAVAAEVVAAGVPEPAPVLLAAVGFVAFALGRRRLPKG